MKKYQTVLSMIGLALAVCAGGSARASELLNIPSSAALPYDSHCESVPGFGIEGASADTCMVDFPVTIPFGHTIRQVNVLHGTFSYIPAPSIDVAFGQQGLNSPWGFVQTFVWNSSAYVPDGTLQVTHMMAQLGKNYPDSFLVDNNQLYRVVVQLSGGAWVAGIQVIYD